MVGQSACERAGAAVVAALLFLWLAACGGGGGGGQPVPSDEGVFYAGAVSLVDGRVGDSPFYDDDSGAGVADGRAFPVAGAAELTIEWNPPLLQWDQAQETRLAGYRIYYGHQPGSYEYVIEIGEPEACSYRLAGLPRGTYYFAVSAVDVGNREGPLSGGASITVY